MAESYNRCRSCDQIYQLATTVQARKVPPELAYIQPLTDNAEDLDYP